jgi:hypothetical protein
VVHDHWLLLLVVEAVVDLRGLAVVLLLLLVFLVVPSILLLVVIVLQLLLLLMLSLIHHLLLVLIPLVNPFFFTSLHHNLIYVRLYLRGEQVSQLGVQVMLLRKLAGQVEWVIPLEHLDILLLPSSDVYGDREELVWCHLGLHIV